MLGAERKECIIWRVWPYILSLEKSVGVLPVIRERKESYSRDSQRLQCRRDSGGLKELQLACRGVPVKIQWRIFAVPRDHGRIVVSKSGEL